MAAPRKPLLLLAQLLLALVLPVALLHSFSCGPTSAFAQDVQADRWVYNLTQSALNATTATPLAFPAGGGTPVLRARLDVTLNVPLGFTFLFYGRAYTAVNVSASGNLQFETSSAVAVMASALPGGPAAQQPFIAFFWCAMDWSGQAASNATYATLGSTVGSRVWVLRVENVYLNTVYSPHSIDVMLWETSNVIEVRYYNIPASTYWLMIGISGKPHDDFSVEWTAWLNSASFSTRYTTLNYTSLTYTPVSYTPYVSNVATPAPQFQGSYNATLIANTASAVSAGTLAPLPSLSGATQVAGSSSDTTITINLGFTFTFYGGQFSIVYLNNNGLLLFVSTSASASTFAIPSASAVSGGVAPLLAFAYSDWQPSSTGMISYVVATAADGVNQVLRINYNGVPHATNANALLSCDVLLYQADSSIEVRYTQVPSVKANMAIGIQSASQLSPGQYDYVSVMNNTLVSANVVSALQGATVRFVLANATLANQLVAHRSLSFNSTLVVSSPSSPIAPRQPLNQATRVMLEAANDNTEYVTFGFAVWFGAKVYSGAYLTTNGELQFGSAVPVWSSLTLPDRTTTRTPVFAFFYADMFPLLSGEREYATSGTYPNRVFTLRWSGVPYASTAGASASVPSVSLDVLIFESDNHFEVRYYSVNASAQAVVIGAQTVNSVYADGSMDYVSVANNVAVTSALASQLTGATWYVYATNATRLPSYDTTYTYRRARTPARLSLSAPVTYSPTSATPWSGLPIGFPFSFVGTNYTTISLSMYGYALLGTSSTELYGAQAFPSGLSSYAPLLAVFQSAIDPSSAAVARSPRLQYQTLGAAPSRMFVAQFSNISLLSNDATLLNADLVLYESNSTIEMRYYTVPLSVSYMVSIGVMASSTARADGSYDMSVFTSAGVPSNALAEDLVQESIVFYVGDPSSVVVPLSDTYNVTSVSLPSSALTALPALPTPSASTSVTYLPMIDDSSVVVPIGFPFLFYTGRATFVQVGTEGTMTFLTPVDLVSPSQLPLTSSTSLPLFAFFWTRLYVSPSSSSWMYVTSGAFPNRVFTLRLVDVQYQLDVANGTVAVGTVSLDVQLYEYDSRIAVSYYRVSASSTLQPVVIGVQGSATQRYDRTYDYTTWINLTPLSAFVATALQGSQLAFQLVESIDPPTALQSLDASTVTGSSRYRSTHTLGTRPSDRANLTSSATQVTSLTSLTSVATGIPIGFNFTFFDGTYSTLSVAAVGTVQFASALSTAASAMPGVATTMRPYIAFFWTYLNPWTSPSRVTYQTLGVAPARMFVLRFDSVRYNIAVGRASVDVVLFEQDSAIELRYYAVYPLTSSYYFTVGIEGPSNEYVAVVNRVNADPLLAERLSYSTVRFNFSSIVVPTAAPSSSVVVVAPSSSVVVAAPSSSVALRSSSVLAPTSSQVLPASSAPRPSSSVLAPSSSQTLPPSSVPRPSSSVSLPSSSAAVVPSSAPTPVVPASSSVAASISSSLSPSSSSSSGSTDLPPPASSASSSSSLSDGAIAGIVIGVVIGVIVLLALGLLVRARVSKRSSSFSIGDGVPAALRPSNDGHAQLEESGVTRTQAAAGEVELSTMGGETDASVPIVGGGAAQQSHVEPQPHEDDVVDGSDASADDGEFITDREVADADLTV